MLAERLTLRQRTGRSQRQALVVCGGIATAIALILGLLVPPGGDASAHLYRTLLVQHGVLLWDNLWFAGQYPLVSYCLFYYLPAAVLGNTLLAAAGVLLSALLFASMVLRVWGAAARWPAYWFAAVVGGQFFTGDYPYTLGFTALLATLWALQRGRTWLAVISATITLGCSPLAFLFLCLALFALALRSAQPPSRVLTLLVTLAVLAGVELGALLLFPSRGLYYSFGTWRLPIGMAIGLSGSALAARSAAARPLLKIFVVWTAVTFAGYFVSSPVGHNLLRPAAVVFPIMLLTARLAGYRPRWLVVPALAGAFAVNVFPYATTLIARSDQASHASFWAPMLSYVTEHSSPSFRLEVVPTVNHWEAYFVPKAGFAIARGWYEQLDTGDNPALFRGQLTGARYRDWLRSVGVRYVLLAHAALASGSSQEAGLLASGRSGLVRVFVSHDGDIYELPHATPILTGPGAAALTAQSHSGIDGWVSQPGVYLLRVHYTLLWRLARGSLCLERAPNGMTAIDVRRPGAFTLRAGEGVSALIGVVSGQQASLACVDARSSPLASPGRARV